MSPCCAVLLGKWGDVWDLKGRLRGPCCRQRELLSCVWLVSGPSTCCSFLDEVLLRPTSRRRCCELEGLRRPRLLQVMKRTQRAAVCLLHASGCWSCRLRVRENVWPWGALCLLACVQLLQTRQS